MSAIPNIPKITPPPALPPVAPEEWGFTVADALEWLGLPQRFFTWSQEYLAGRHGNPIMSALLDARDAQGTETTPEEVLARYDIDPENPEQAVRDYEQRARGFDA